MNHVFISYSSKDRYTADAVRNLLQKRGIKCWMAPHDIPVGQKYAGVISKAVRECGCFLLLLTNDSQQSVWVAKEVERAVNYNKSIITIQLEDVTLNDEFELYISSEQMIAVPTIDATNENMQKVLSAIIALVGKSPTIENIADFKESFNRDLEFGDVINEKYIVNRKIAEGGFGKVYSAALFDSEEEFAIKVSFNSAEEQVYVSESTIDRIMQLHSPYLCMVFEHFVFMDKLCIVEEYLDRYVNIKDYVEIAKQADTDTVLLMIQVLRGLKTLHENDIFHGDLSPYNIMVSTDGNVKITDYSSSFVKGGPPTGEHTVVYTYAAPDFLYTESSEIFSVGLIAFELLTGSIGARNGVGELVNLGKPIAKELEDILNKATAIKAENRYGSADEFIDALEGYLLSGQE